MGCSSCGQHIRRLARQYPYMNVKPIIPKNKEHIKAKLRELNKFSINVEEIDSEQTQTIDDLSVIHTV